MMLDNVADWFDWADAGADDVELSRRLEALDHIVKRLALLNRTRWDWLSKMGRNQREMAHNWSKIYDFFALALERVNNLNLTELERERTRSAVEDSSLYRGRQAIHYLSPECIMLVVPEKLSLEEQLEEDEKIA